MSVFKIIDNSSPTNQLNNQNSSQQNNTEIKTLENSIANTLEEINVIFKQLQHIEKEISIYLDSYYGDTSESSINDNYKALDTKPSIRLRNLYNDINKVCDIDLTKESKTQISEKNYDIENLIKIENYLNGENNESEESIKDKLVNIYKELANLQRKIKMTKSDKVTFIAPISDIRRKLVWAKICFEDIISKTKKDLIKRIPQKLDA